MSTLDHAFREVIGALSRAAAADVPRREDLSGTLAAIDRLARCSSFGASRRLFERGFTAMGAAAALTAGAAAQPHNPAEFATQGVAVLDGYVSFNTDLGQMTSSNPARSFQGDVTADGAVWAFDDLSIASGAVVTIRGSRPLVLLSRGAMNIYTHLDLEGLEGDISAGSGQGGSGGPGGQGGGDAAPTYAKRGHGPGGGAPGWGVPAGGGNFGAAVTTGSGLPYGDLFKHLEGGSGGGAFVSVSGTSRRGGGGGGGAIELGALGPIQVRGSINVPGGGSYGGAGAGSGGGILIHAPIVDLENAGLVASGGVALGGNAGCGGRIIVQRSNSDSFWYTVDGGAGVSATAGTAGFFSPTVEAADLDFGTVPVGTSRTMHLVVSMPPSSGGVVCGEIGVASAPFVVAGGRTFSGLTAGRSAAFECTFSPAAEGLVQQTVQVRTDAGTINVTLRGVGGNACGSGDFNGDGDFGTDQDIEAFFRVLGGGSC